MTRIWTTAGETLAAKFSKASLNWTRVRRDAEAESSGFGFDFSDAALGVGVGLAGFWAGRQVEVRMSAAI